MMAIRRFCRLPLWSLVVAFLGPLAPSGLRAADPARPSEAETAAKVDAALLRDLGPDAHPPAPVDDEAFLRRVFLDLTGKLPDPDAIRRFVADRAADKRARVIDALLQSDAYAVNWGRYWRDTVTYHTPASGNYLRWKAFDAWWTTQVRRNRPWNEVVTSLVTASGVNDETASVNYLTAMYGNPSEIAATTSRVFLGVQIQCAECHDAKFEPWKREQFHELAAFFGRARLVQHKDVEGRGTPYAIESRADGQYCMTDKKDPTHLIPMRPRFLTGESVSLDADDAQRREALARLHHGPEKSVVRPLLRQPRLDRPDGLGILPHRDRRGVGGGPAQGGAGPAGERLARQRRRPQVAVPHHRPDAGVPAAEPLAPRPPAGGEGGGAAGGLPRTAAAGAGI